MLSARIISAVIFFIALFLGLFYSPLSWIMVVLLALGALTSIYEFMRFGRKTPSPYQFLAYLAALALLADAYLWSLEHAVMILGLLTVISMGLGTIRLEKNFSEVTGKSLIGTLYCTLPFALIMMIWRRAVEVDTSNGQHYLIFLILITQSSDIGAYFVGRWLGKHKLAPQLSPGKTVEGFIGGVVFTVLLAMLFHFLWNNIANIFSLWEVMFLGAVFSIIGPLGDLTESWLKRQAGIKDSGRTFTGHGGMLDIVDSLLFTTIFYYIYLYFFHPVVLGIQHF